MTVFKNKNLIESYLSFSLGEEKFAAHVDKVINILEMRSITKVPQAPAYMKGVINLRGSVLPVIDLRLKFELEDTGFSVDTCIIVLNVEINNKKVIVGALIDEVNEVLEFSETNIEPAPSIGRKYNAEFISGMYRTEDSFVMILNIDRIFAEEDKFIIKNSKIKLKMNN